MERAVSVAGKEEKCTGGLAEGDRRRSPQPSADHPASIREPASQSGWKTGRVAKLGMQTWRQKEDSRARDSLS